MALLSIFRRSLCPWLINAEGRLVLLKGQPYYNCGESVFSIEQRCYSSCVNGCGTLGFPSTLTCTVLGRFAIPTSNQDHIRSCSTKSLFHLTETNAGQVQPVLDLENIFQNEQEIQMSVSKRKLKRKPISTAKALYATALEAKKVRDETQKRRDDNTAKIQQLVRSGEKEVQAEGIKTLKDAGRQLREEHRVAEARFNQYNDELVDYVLSLPNKVDPGTPEKEAVLFKEHSVPEGIQKWEFPQYVAVESPVGPGLLSEFPIGYSAWLDLQLREKAQTHLLKGGFVETGNTEYVKRVILQGIGIDPGQFLRIREPNMKKGWDHATYLAGGASFPSFLALFAQSIIDSPTCLPLRYFVIGRSYQMRKDRPGSYQSHNVQAFVACRNADEMEQEFNRLRDLMESFYSTQVGFAFQTQLVPASRLKLYEKKKLAFVMNKTDKTPSKMVGTLSTIGDYVSKRLLCCYFDEKKQPQFLHLVSAQFFDITHFLRTSPPTKVDHFGAPMDEPKTAAAAAVAEMKKLLGDLPPPGPEVKS